MSDYLNNLTARALQRQEAVRPRLASLFEPQATTTGGPLAGRPTDLNSIAGQDPSAASTVMPPVRTEAALSSDSRAPSDGSAAPRKITWRGAELSTDAAGDVRREGEGSQAGEPSEGASAARRPAPRPEPPGAEGEFSTQAARTVTPPPSKDDEVRARRSASADERGAVEGDGETASREEVRSLAERVASLAASRGGEGVGREPSEAARAGVRPAPQPLTPRLPAPPAPLANLAARAAEPPRVTVTIGRVDVRAVMSQTPEPRPAAAAQAPKPSLAEYLKRRERGRR